MKRLIPLGIAITLLVPVFTHDPFPQNIRGPAAEKRGVLTRVEGFVGGINRCQSPTAQEISFASKKIGRPQVATVEDLEDLFFQEMARRSYAATTCQFSFIESYFSDRSIESTLNENGLKVFQSFQSVLRKMIIARNEKHSMSENIRMGHDPMDKSYAQAKQDMKGAELREEVRELDQAINAIVAQVPLGSHVLVRNALRKLALENSVSESDFIHAYSKSLEALKPKLQEAKEYFEDKEDKSGSYNLSRKDKIAFMQSGRASVLLSELDPEGKALSCRLKAQYMNGPATTQLVAMLGLLAASAVTDGAAAVLVGLGVTGSMIADIQRECFKPTMNLSSEATLSCDPKQMMASSISEASMLSCGVAVGFVAMPAVKTFATELRAGIKSAQKAKNVTQAEKQVLVTAGKALPAEKPVIPKVSAANQTELKAIQSELGTCIESLPKDVQKRIRIKFHNQSEEKTMKDLRDMRDLRRINGACK